MQIKNIIIKYDDISGESQKNYLFDKKKINLIYSNGINTRGKTTLIRFIIWGLGFNISLTSEFDSEYAETEIELDNSKISKVIRRWNKVEFYFSDNRHIQKLSILSDSLKIKKLLFGESNISEDIYSQLIGYFYFEQDNGYKSWNRGNVVQQLNNESVSYNINIEDLLASLNDIDYKSYKNRKRYYTTASDATLGLTNMIKSSKNFMSVSDDKREEVKKITDKISSLKLKLLRVEEKKSIYTENIKDYEAFFALIKKLSLNIKYEDRIIPVTSKNIIHDDSYSLKLYGYKRYYSDIESELKDKINSLEQKKEILLNLVKKGNQTDLLDADDNYEKIQKSIISSGIELHESEEVHKQMSKLKKECIDDFEKSIFSSKDYDNIWNKIVDIAKSMKIKNSKFSDYFDVKDNKIWTKKTPFSGAERTLLVISYRLGVLSFLEKKYKIKLPLIFDSPAYSEMDENNLDLFIKMIKSKFNDHQIIIATNQKVKNIKSMSKISVNDGVFGTLKKF